MFEALRAAAHRIGKPSWRPALSYLVDLHERATHQPTPPLPYPWTGSLHNTDALLCFNTLDAAHIALDTLSYAPQHAFFQLSNIIACQRPDGFIPHELIINPDGSYRAKKMTAPPFWVLVINDILKPKLLPFVLKHIEWFEHYRRCDNGGFYFLDAIDHICESGVQDSPRFDAPTTKDSLTSIDATSLMYALYDTIDHAKKNALRTLITHTLICPKSGYFFDGWDKSGSVRTFEGLFPLIAKAATHEQARFIIDSYILSPKVFFAEHPLATISLSDPLYNSGHWRGPARNSLTYWIASACVHYNRPDAALCLLERALDSTCNWFEKTNRLWEYYPPRAFTRPALEDHLGHNPLFAMAELWSALEQEDKASQGRRPSHQ